MEDILQAQNLELVTLVGDATHITVWRKLRVVVMRYSSGRRYVYRKLMVTALSNLERALAERGWRLQIGNACRTVWTP